MGLKKKKRLKKKKTKKETQDSHVFIDRIMQTKYIHDTHMQ